MLFLPISFAPFRRLNNVCVSATCTWLDAGGADGSHQYAECVIRMTPSTVRLQISATFHHVILSVNEIRLDREVVQTSDFIYSPPCARLISVAHSIELVSLIL